MSRGQRNLVLATLIVALVNNVVLLVHAIASWKATP